MSLQKIDFNFYRHNAEHLSTKKVAGIAACRPYSAYLIERFLFTTVKHFANSCNGNRTSNQLGRASNQSVFMRVQIFIFEPKGPVIKPIQPRSKTCSIMSSTPSHIVYPISSQLVLFALLSFLFLLDSCLSPILSSSSSAFSELTSQ